LFSDGKAVVVSSGDASCGSFLVTVSSVELLPLDDSVWEFDEVVELDEVDRPAFVAGLLRVVWFGASNAVATKTITRAPVP
jgi:hypothetical protein